jgi:hypothetical protein
MRYLILFALIVLVSCSSTPEPGSYLSESEVSSLQDCNFVLKYSPEEVKTPIYFKFQHPYEIMVWKNTPNYYYVNTFDHNSGLTVNHTVKTFYEVFEILEQTLPCESYK